MTIQERHIIYKKMLKKMTITNYFFCPLANQIGTVLDEKLIELWSFKPKETVNTLGWFYGSNSPSHWTGKDFYKHRREILIKCIEMTKPKESKIKRILKRLFKKQ